MVLVDIWKADAEPFPVHLILYPLVRLLREAMGRILDMARPLASGGWRSKDQGVSTKPEVADRIQVHAPPKILERLNGESGVIFDVAKLLLLYNANASSVLKIPDSCIVSSHDRNDSSRLVGPSQKSYASPDGLGGADRQIRCERDGQSDRLARAFCSADPAIGTPSSEGVIYGVKLHHMLSASRTRPSQISR